MSVSNEEDKMRGYTTSTPARDVFPWGYHETGGLTYMTTETAIRVIKGRIASGHTGLTLKRNA